MQRRAHHAQPDGRSGGPTVHSLTGRSASTATGRKFTLSSVMMFAVTLPLLVYMALVIVGITVVPSHLPSPPSPLASGSTASSSHDNDVHAPGVHPRKPKLLAGKENPLHHLARQATEKISTSKTAELIGDVKSSNSLIDDSNVNYHIIFSTGCSAFQDWQSYVFFYGAMVSGQPGTITRIVSGCNAENEATMRQVFDEQIAPMSPDGRFKIHFTPDYSKVKPGVNYKYFNKPFGTKHWMENALGYPDNVSKKDDDSIVVLMDPDQLIMRPFRDNNFSNTEWRFLAKQETPRTRVEHGAPMGELYLFGLQWKQKINMTQVAAKDELPSPVDQLSNHEAQRGYIVGPPYIATGRDMYAIATKWKEFVPKVHDQYPYLLAEMFAYCLAAAHLKLPHQVATSFMISSVTAGGGEGWSYVDKLPDKDVCTKIDNVELLPTAIHFCQKYHWGPFFFGKYRFPKDFLTCDSPLLVEPPVDILTRYDRVYFPGAKKHHLDTKEAKRHVFVVCNMLRTLNEAANYFKARHCAPPKAANLAHKIVFDKSFGTNYTIA